LLTRIFTRANIAVEERVWEVEVKPKPDEQERALFREATRGVKPLAHAPRVGTAPRAPRPQARFSRGAQWPDLEPALRGAPEEPELAAGDPSLFVRPGVPGTMLRRLRRGQFPPEAELDLHGLTVPAAQRLLHEFLVTALQRGLRCVRIVHGKGLRSGPRGPVLRQLVNATLRGLAQVRAFASARQADGGTGAVYVLLDGPAHASSPSTAAE
jgi:DNA-nicking Smr family endonuclease